MPPLVEKGLLRLAVLFGALTIVFAVGSAVSDEFNIRTRLREDCQPPAGLGPEAHGNRRGRDALFLSKPQGIARGRRES